MRFAEVDEILNPESMDFRSGGESERAQKPGVKPRQKEPPLLKMAPSESDTNSSQSDPAIENDVTNSWTDDQNQPSDNETDASSFEMDDEEPKIYHIKTVNGDLLPQLDSTIESKNDNKVLHDVTKSIERMQEDEKAASNERKTLKEEMEGETPKQKDDSGKQDRSDPKQKVSNMLKMAPSGIDTSSDESENNVNQSHEDHVDQQLDKFKQERVKCVKSDKNDRSPSSVKKFFKSILPSKKFQKDVASYCRNKDTEQSELQGNPSFNDGIHDRLSNQVDKEDRVKRDAKPNETNKHKMAPSECDTSSDESDAENGNDVIDPRDEQPQASDEAEPDPSEEAPPTRTNERPSRIRKFFMRIAPCIFKDSTQD